MTKSVARAQAVQRIHHDEEEEEMQHTHQQLQQQSSHMEELVQALEESKAAVQDARAEAQRLQDENDHLREMVVALEEQLKTANVKISSHTDSLAQLHASMKQQRETDMAAWQQQSQRATGVLQLRIDGQEKMIQTLQQEIKQLEAENQKLNSQLVDLLEEETQRDLEGYASTAEGAELSRTGSILSNKGSAIVAKPASPEPAATPASAPATSEEHEVNMTVMDADKTKTEDVETAMASEEDAVESKENKPERKRRSKVDEMVDEALHSPRESVPLKATKKRRFFKKTDIRSPAMGPNESMSTQSKVERLLTPIARRLRRR